MSKHVVPLAPTLTLSMATVKSSPQPNFQFTGAGCLLLTGLAIALLGFFSIIGGSKGGGAFVLLSGLALYIVGWFLVRAEKKRGEQSASEHAVKKFLQLAQECGGRVSAAQAIAADVATSAGWMGLVAELEKQGLGAVELDERGTQVVVVRGLQTSDSSPASSDNRSAPRELHDAQSSAALKATSTPATGGSSVNSSAPPDRFVNVPVEPERDLSASISFIMETPSSRFLAAARAVHSMEGSQVEHVPFMQYWPTYESLAPSQLAWYLFWRSQVRRGVYLETDLSYIYLHVYELLNLVESPEVRTAVARLDELVKSYQIAYPQLAWRLQDWSGDLLATKGQIAEAIKRWSSGQLVNLGNRGPVGNLVVHNHVVAQRLADLPGAWWMELARYHPRNKFYTEYNEDGRIDAGYFRAALVAERHSREKNGRSVIDFLTPPDIVRLKKPLFVSALVDDAIPAEVDLGGVRDYFGSIRLAEHLTSAMRHAENLMRKQLGFNRKLSGVSIDPTLAAMLDKEFAPMAAPTAPAPLRLDSAKIDQIRKETESVEALLRSDDELPDAPAAKPPTSKPSKELYTDLEEVRQLWRLLPEEDRDFIRSLFDGSHSAPQTSHVDEINAKATPLLGDRLLFVENNVVVIAEDYLDEFQIILREPIDSTASASAGVVMWARLVASLNDTELHLLRDAANDGILDETELASLGRSYRIMPHALLETVNERACELVGIPILYPDGDRWLVEEELLDALRGALSPDRSFVAPK